MSFLEVIRSALRGMASNKLRSFLTLLGVLIGVGSVILLVGVGNGAAQDVTEQIGSLGSQQLTVRASSSGGSNATRSQALTMESVTALEESARGEHIDTVVPQGSSSATLSVGTTSTSASIIGTTPNYFEATASSVAQGIGFTQNDYDTSRRVIVLGAELAQTLFGTDDPVGQQVIVGTTPYLVNGVLAAKDDSGMTSTNNVAVMPLTRLERSLAGYGALSTITLTATTSEDVTEAQTEATIILSEQLGVSSSDDAPFTISAQSQLLSAQSSATDTFTSMLAAVAALSLVVGGIGVTNIMLVTVTERTREIGIRKALGARRGTILTQFLIEATLLSLLGGALGVGAAYLGSRFTIMGVTPQIVPSTVLLALAVSVAIGVIFGGYPALRASRMRPVDALRHD
jgi:putative ABC transport system permease protein